MVLLAEAACTVSPREMFNERPYRLFYLSLCPEISFQVENFRLSPSPHQKAQSLVEAKTRVVSRAPDHFQRCIGNTTVFRTTSASCSSEVQLEGIYMTLNCGYSSNQSQTSCDKRQGSASKLMMPTVSVLKLFQGSWCLPGCDHKHREHGTSTGGPLQITSSICILMRLYVRA